MILKTIFISVIVPVYNRPDEVEELLESLTNQSINNFEVVLVEDGSTRKSDHLVDQYKDKINLRYFFKENGGPALARNYGAEKAKGNYFIFFDSDCVIPPSYFEFIENRLKSNYVDAFGGPDKADDYFSKTQKAINYSMTSFLTTGGIRGGKTKVDVFYPRSFNLGVSKEVFEKLKGYANMRFGEDLDFSMRIVEAGYKTELMLDAYVYHKRRTDMKKFFKQVYNSGIARINLEKRHPGTLRMVHFFPSFFMIGVIGLLALSFIHIALVYPIAIIGAILFIDSAIRNRSVLVGVISVVSSFVQMFGYGSGFIVSYWRRNILRKPEFSAFVENLYD